MNSSPTQLQRQSTWKPAIVSLLLVFGAVGMSRCNYIGPIVAITSGPDKTPAKFTLDKERPTVILIDDRANRLPSRSLRIQIAEQAQTDLLSNKALKDVIDARSSAVALTQERDKELMDISTIGKSVKAEIVIYAVVEEVALSADGQSLSPKAVLRVKVIDVNKKPPRVWPEDSKGYTLVVQPNLNSRTSYSSAGAAQAAAFDTFAVEIGTRLAELFYEHVTKRSISETRPD